ncbi:SWI/SNF complex subunit SWI3A isoform X2 [Impatiens glandulifera]|uniref:SWI/SNF complex subunit SWI3A isoform X2 n=1 Tax=Impatiens glandulifera TaxID=253017 RepID=UPI001FB0E4A4|nr:SWI/SNF complex subunit SWI3A isoform X2 [Impatiens glandulifera]
MDSSMDLKTSSGQSPSDDHHLDLYTIPTHSSWFLWNDIHDTEKLHLREFFDGSSMTRTPKIYKEYRDFIISKYREDPLRRLTFTEIRKSLVGDVCLLHKVFSFLDKWGLINFGVLDDEERVEDVETEGNWNVKLEEGAPIGVRVVAVPNSLKPVCLPQDGSDSSGNEVDNVVKLPVLASYKDVYGEVKGMLCGNCKEVCESEHYHCTKEEDMIICSKCYKNGNYGVNRSADDFNLIQSITNKTKSDAIWTEAETLVLLESVFKHGDDWEAVTQNVKTKSKQECIWKLIQLPFGEYMFGSAYKKDHTDANMIVSKHGELTSNESHSQEKTEAKVQDNELEHKGEQNGDTEMETPTLKRRRSASPSDNRGTLMEQVALISSLVGPHITASAASAAITALCHEIQCPNEIFDGDDSDNHVLGSSLEDMLDREHRDEGTEAGGGPETHSTQEKDTIPYTLRIRAATATALGAAAAHAKLLADQEEREIENQMANIIEAQLKKLRHKVDNFEDLEQIMEKEYAQVERLKKALTSDRLSVLQNLMNAGISGWRDHAPVKSA